MARPRNASSASIRTGWRLVLDVPAPVATLRWACDTRYPPVAPRGYPFAGRRRPRSLHWLVVLRLVLPKGSLERATLELFEAADLTVNRSSAVDYKATIDDPRIDEVRILRPQEIPRYVAEGLFDLGITGRDWIEETGGDVVTLGELAYSKATANPIRVVVAVAGDADVKRVDDLPNGRAGVDRVPRADPALLRGRGASRPTSGCPTGRPRPRSPTSPTASSTSPRPGRALRAAGLRIIDTILVSYTELVANPAAAADPAKRHAMDQLLTLLHGALEARGKVLVKLNVAEADSTAVIALLPSMKSPTVSALAGGGYAVETVVREAHDQHADPGPEGRRGHRHPRAAAVEDRALMMDGTVPPSTDCRRGATAVASTTTGSARATTAPPTPSTAPRSPTAPAPSPSATAVTFAVRPGIGVATRRPPSPRRDGQLRPAVRPWSAATLHEGQPDLGQGVAQDGCRSAQAVADGVDHGGHGVDGERRLAQVGRLLGRGGWRPARTGPWRGWPRPAAAGTSASRRRTSSISARSSASAAPSNSARRRSLVVGPGGRAGRRSSGSAMLAARCPQAAHLRYPIGRTTEGSGASSREGPHPAT